MVHFYFWFLWVEIKGSFFLYELISLKFHSQVWTNLCDSAKTIHHSDRCGTSSCWWRSVIFGQVCLGLVTLKGHDKVTHFTCLHLTCHRRRQSSCWQPAVSAELSWMGLSGTIIPQVTIDNQQKLLAVVKVWLVTTDLPSPIKCFKMYTCSSLKLLTQVRQLFCSPSTKCTGRFLICGDF